MQHFAARGGWPQNEGMNTLKKGYRLRLPLRVPLGGLDYRDVTLTEGEFGWGEFSPLPGYPCDPATGWAAAGEASDGPAWPDPVREWVDVSDVITAVEPDEAARAAAASTCSTIKVKVGDADDIDRVAAVRGAVGPHTKIRVDANGAWDVDTAVDRISRLVHFDIEMVEQPVASIEDLAAVRLRVEVPIAADECVRGVDDARRLRLLDAADIVVLKVQPLGGVWAALAVAETAGLPAVVTSMFESSIGLAAGLALAAALPKLPYACGLGSAGLFHSDVVAEPLLPEGGRLRLRRTAPDPVLLARFMTGRG